MRSSEKHLRARNLRSLRAFALAWALFFLVIGFHPVHERLTLEESETLEGPGQCDLCLLLCQTDVVEGVSDLGTTWGPASRTEVCPAAPSMPSPILSLSRPRAPPWDVG